MDMRDYLIELFTERDELERRLRIVEGRIKAAGRAYSKDKGFVFPLAMDLLRNHIVREKEDACS